MDYFFGCLPRPVQVVPEKKKQGLQQNNTSSIYECSPSIATCKLDSIELHVSRRDIRKSDLTGDKRSHRRDISKIYAVLANSDDLLSCPKPQNLRRTQKAMASYCMYMAKKHIPL